MHHTLSIHLQKLLLQFNLCSLTSMEPPFILLLVNFLQVSGSAIARYSVFVAFVEDNATMSSIPYFENNVSYFVQNRRK